MISVCDTCLEYRGHQAGDLRGHIGAICEVCGRHIEAPRLPHRETTASMLPPRPSRSRAFWDALRSRAAAVPRHPPPHRFVEDHRRLLSFDMRPPVPSGALRAIPPRRPERPEMRHDLSSDRPTSQEVAWPEQSVHETLRRRHWLAAGVGVLIVLGSVMFLSSSAIAPDTVDTERRPADWSGTPAAEIPQDPQREDFEESAEGARGAPGETQPATPEMLEREPAWTEVAPATAPPLDDDATEIDPRAWRNTPPSPMP